MVMIGLLALCILAIIFFFYRSENFKKEILQYKNTLSKQANESRFAQKCIIQLAELQQKTLNAQLQNLKSGAIDPSKYELQSLIIESFSYVIADVNEKKVTPREAVENYFSKNSELSSEQLANFMSEQDSSIKRAWIGNTLSHFINLCLLLVEPKG